MANVSGRKRRKRGKRKRLPTKRRGKENERIDEKGDVL